MTDQLFAQAVKAVQGKLATKQNAIEWQMAMTGDGHGLVDAGNGTLYVRLTSNSSVIQVLNGGISLADGVLCRIIKPAEDPLNWYAIRATDQRIDESGTGGGSPMYNTPPHHLLHEYLGVDQVNVDWRQITTLRVYAYSGFTIGVLAGLLPRSGADLVVPSQTIDLTSHVPAAGALYVLISVDSTGALVATDGTAAGGLLTLTLGDIPDTPSGNFRLAAVRLYAGQTAISESTASNDIRDLRWPQERLASSILPADMTLARGSLIVGNSSGVGTALSVGAANKVLQADGTDTAWSTNTLSIAGNSTINGSLVGNMTGGGTVATGGFTLTVPATGTAALGTGSANQIAVWSGTNTVSGSGLLTFNTAGGAGSGAIFAAQSATDTLAKFARFVVGHYTNAEEPLIGFNITSDSATSITDFGGGSSLFNAATLVRFYTAANNTTLTGTLRLSIDSTGNVITAANKYVGGSLMVGSTLTAPDVKIHALTSTAGAWSGLRLQNNNSATNDTADIDFKMTSSGSFAATARIGATRVGGGAVTDLIFSTLDSTATLRERLRIANTGLSTFTRENATTNAVDTVLTLAHNSTGTAAANFGGAIALNLESATTSDQTAAALKWLWTDATHVTRTSRADIETTGPGHCAAWGYNGVDGTARYIINNGTGDVTEGVTVQYVASEVTGTDSYGGVVYLEPSDSFAICTDGTNTLVMTCAADGSLYVQRSAGTDTFKFSCWAVWQ